MAKTRSKADPRAEARRLQKEARAVLDEISGLADQLGEKAQQLDELAAEHGRALVTERADGADPERIAETRMCDFRDMVSSFVASWRKHYRRVTDHNIL